MRGVRAMAAARKPSIETPSVEERLMDGHYDRLLESFQQQIDEAAAMLRRCHAAMRAENTLRS
jgi:hypothetical protein